jgi:hypothetical protein
MSHLEKTSKGLVSPIVPGRERRVIAANPSRALLLYNFPE